MKRILIVVLFFHQQVSGSLSSSSDREFKYPRFNAYQLLYDVRNAIHTRKIAVLEDLLISESSQVVSKELSNIFIKNIPVHEIFDVANIDVTLLPTVTFQGEVGEFFSNFTAVYSKSEKRYLLSQENILDLLVDKVALEKSLNDQGKLDALQLLINLQSAIKTKKYADFMGLVTPSARFMTCDGKLKEAETVFEEIYKIPTTIIPVTQNVEVTTVNVAKTETYRMVFHAKTGVQYTAEYSLEHSKWLLDQENCAEYYSALINQTALGEEIAFQSFHRLSYAMELLSTRRYHEIVANKFTVVSCDEVNKNEFKGFSFLHHYLDFKQYYEIDDYIYHVSNVVFNATSGSLKFFAILNSLATNEVLIERNDGEYRIVEMRNLKCHDLSFSNQNSRDKKSYVYAMKLAEEMTAKYVHVTHTRNREKFLELFTDPYKISNGTLIRHEDIWFPDYVPDLYVIDVHCDYWGLRSFRAKFKYYKEGYKFRVYNELNGETKLLSETRFLLK